MQELLQAGISAKFGYQLTFNKWIKIGFPFTIVTVVIGMVSLSIFIIVILHANASSYYFFVNMNVFYATFRFWIRLFKNEG